MEEALQFAAARESALLKTIDGAGGSCPACRRTLCLRKRWPITMYYAYTVRYDTY